MNEVSSEIGKLETPFYKLIFYFSISSLVVFLLLYFFSIHRNQFYEKSYHEIQKHGKKTFGTISDNFIKNEKKIFIYTYVLTDEYGVRFEISEQVDEKTHLKLRVGNTIPVKFYQTNYFHVSKIFSRIEGNFSKFPNSKFLIQFSQLGILFSILSMLLSVYYFFKK